MTPASLIEPKPETERNKIFSICLKYDLGFPKARSIWLLFGGGNGLNLLDQVC